MLDLTKLLQISRWKKRLLSVGIDIAGLVTIAILAVGLRLGEFPFPLEEYTTAIILLPLFAIPVFIRIGLYRAVIRYIGHRFIFVALGAVSLSFLLWSTAIFMFDLSFPRSAILIAWFIAMLYVVVTRLTARWLLTTLNGQNPSAISVIIYGAGESGRQLMQAMNNITSHQVVAFIDDDPMLKKHKIGSIKIYTAEDLPSLIERFKVTEILLAIPSLSAKQKKPLIERLEPLAVKISSLPPFEEIVSGKIAFSDIREVAIEDLLGRDPIAPRKELLTRCITDKVVLVSGAGGSIGAEICRQVLRQQPSMLILFEISEFALYQIEKELQKLGFDEKVKIIAIIGSVLNAKKLTKLMQKYPIDTIYHAAAYKHVPIVEHNIVEGITNNAFGTFNLAEIAAENKVQNFVLISTDKAVRPTNFMGASKRLAEMSLQALQDEFSQTTFVMVRFGNVLGSSGSVIPLFRKQIATGGPVTITHQDITRYFMTIPEAASLVIQAGSMGVGGDVFVLDMGEPIKIVDLAKKLIHLSGLEVKKSPEDNNHIELEFTGLRPGEKLYEELLIGDNVDGTEHPRIMKAHENYLPYLKLKTEFNHLTLSLEQDDYEAVSIKLSEIVTGFNHSSGIVDYLK